MLLVRVTFPLRSLTIPLADGKWLELGVFCCIREESKAKGEIRSWVLENESSAEAGVYN